VLQALALILLTWRIWWAPNNASKWQMGFNSASKVLIQQYKQPTTCNNFGFIDHFKTALHVSGDNFAHPQEHLTVLTAFSMIPGFCCRPVTRLRCPVSVLLILSKQLYMFRAIISPILRGIWLYLQLLVWYTDSVADRWHGWVSTSAVSPVGSRVGVSYQKL
jgi:hypothetical protein